VSALREWRLRGLTLYRSDPGPGAGYWHYRGHKPRLLSARWCRLVGHCWHYWDVGPVIDNGEGPLRFAGGFSTCKRCEARK
jgi:hypothetical protein